MLVYPITAGDVLEAIREGAREGTLAGLANVDFSTADKQDVIKQVLDSLAGKDFATEVTMAQVLAKLSDDPATATKQDAGKAVLDAISGKVATQSTLAQVLQALQGVLNVEGEVTLTGTLMEIYGPTEAERPAANTVPVGAAYISVRPLRVWQSDGSEWLEVT